MWIQTSAQKNVCIIWMGVTSLSFQHCTSKIWSRDDRTKQCQIPHKSYIPFRYMLLILNASRLLPVCDNKSLFSIIYTQCLSFFCLLYTFITIFFVGPFVLFYADRFSLSPSFLFFSCWEGLKFIDCSAQIMYGCVERIFLDLSSHKLPNKAINSTT